MAILLHTGFLQCSSINAHLQQESCNSVTFATGILLFAPGYRLPRLHLFHFSTRFSRRGISAVGEMQNIYKGKQAEYEEQDPEANPENE